MNASGLFGFKKTALTAFFDTATLVLAVLLARLIDGISPVFTRNTLLWMCANLIFGMAVFAVLGLYRFRLPFAGMSEAFRVIAAFGAMACFDLVFLSFERMVSPSVCALTLLLWFNCVMLIRFATRIRRFLAFRFHWQGSYVRVMVVGGGSAGSMIIHEMKTSDKLTLLPICVIDDDPGKQGARVEGVPVVGTRADIVAAAKRYDIGRIFVAMPSVKPSVLREICGTRSA